MNQVSPTQKGGGRVSGERKPTVHELGIDVDVLDWQASGDGPDRLEVAFAGDWVLLRTAAGSQVLVFDHGEWDAFVRGVKDLEFEG